MKKLFASVVCFSLVAIGVSTGGEKGKKGDVKAEGAWTAISGISGGKKAPAELFEKLQLIVTIKGGVEGKYTVTFMGKQVEAGTYKINEKKTPLHLDLTVTEGDDKGKTQLGLLKVEGDTMTVAFAKGDKKDRPKDFAGTEGEVTVFKRGK